MLYVSTRGCTPPVNFKKAVLAGLADDGGLYLPTHCPKLSTDEIKDLKELDYVDLCFSVMRGFIGSEFSDNDLVNTIKAAYHNFGDGDFCPTETINKNEYLLELFHGPTLAFKDFAMQFIGNLFELFLGNDNKRLTIVTATSGDTGSAAVEAFRGKEQVDLFVLFPDGRISNMQRLQMTTSSDSNIFPIAIKGDFDDCQRLVKELFGDNEFKNKVNLSAVNSINWARILAQSVYYFHSALKVNSLERGVNFSVPSGNFGDIYAGYVAKKMGLPINKLLIASNKNDILQRALESGLYNKREVTPSIAPSMDIQIASNFERLLFDIFDGNQAEVRCKMIELNKNDMFKLDNKSLARFRKVFDGRSATDDELRKEILLFYKKYNKVICPHTAAGTRVARSYIEQNPDIPIITLATAHPSKFSEIIDETLKIQVNIPFRLKKLLKYQEDYDFLTAETNLLKKFILDRRKS